LEADGLEVLLASFVAIFASMLALLAAQFLRKGELPTGCTPAGCRRCRGACNAKDGPPGPSGAGEV
jgi:hypothetical protein